MCLIERLAAMMIFVCVLAGSAHAQSVIERLVSPGPLAAAHANVEGRCASCHAAFDRNAQTQLCVACHRPIGADRTAHTGFHGRDRAASAGGCGSCHGDHHGRAAALVSFDPRRFDHASTDYPLHGAHVGVSCASCHPAGRKYRQASTACVDCHRTDEPHHGRLGARCSSCHVDEGWRQIRFDHSDTRFPLVGAHLRARCVTCHAGERYAGTPNTCVACHQNDDAHHGSLGPNCADCHSAVDWRTQRFDHSRTIFPLRGRHASVQCAACHVRPAGQVRLATDCVSCHRDDDQRAHQGRNGASCQQCHSETDWRRTTFNHATQTRFPLRGKHAALTCQQCHVQPARQVQLSMTCISCHRGDDAHAGQEGAQCEQCHNDAGWTTNVHFDHGLARFPLLGAHAGVACASCHQTQRFKDAPGQCAACHRDDDHHQGRLGSNCAACHNAVTWASWSFDHDHQTHFALTGAHIGLQCEACHTQRTSDRVHQSSACIACHRGDDVHRGEFGPECARCHTTTSFRGGAPHL